LLQVVLVAKQGEQTSKLAAELSRYGVRYSMAESAERALQVIEKQQPDVLIIDMAGIPESGRLCAYLKRERKLPVLAITSLEMALTLDGTVDDFLLVPVNGGEVIARAKRLTHGKTETASLERIVRGSLAIDTEKYEVYVGGEPVQLTYREYELLKFLATNTGRVFTRDTLLNRVWGDDFFGGDRTVDVHIRRLRSKIEDETHVYIETVRNIGYRFVKT